MKALPAAEVSGSLAVTGPPSSGELQPASALSADLARRDESQGLVLVPSQPRERPIGSPLQASGADTDPAQDHQELSISGVQSSMTKSIYVSNLPPEADSLWVYER